MKNRKINQLEEKDFRDINDLSYYKSKDEK